MLTVHHLTKSFDQQVVFEDITFSLIPGQCSGLIGPNGCGKTTLLRILAGLDQPDSGHVSRSPELRIGYLPQNLALDPEMTIGQAVGLAAGSIQALEDELAAAANDLLAFPADPLRQARYDDLLQRIQVADTGRAEAILAGLGLGTAAGGPGAYTRIGHLSGGQETRLALALVLLADPQLLLLDEPTNHLDLGMLTWLEDWLQRETGLAGCAALIVSHDRAFLDHTVTRTLAMEPNPPYLRLYSGNYSAYVQQRQAEMARQWAEYQDQQMAVRRMQEDIRRVKAQAAYTERQASSIRVGGSDMKNKGYKSYQQGIAKKVARKAKARETRLEHYLQSDERVEKPQPERSMHLELNSAAYLGRYAIQLNQLSVGYEPSAPLLEGISLEIYAGQRVALTGPNGCGKTTLLRTIAGQCLPLVGEVRLAESARLGWLTQDQAGLDLDQPAVQVMLPFIGNETRARTFLASFLITGDEALKPVGQLSYGQRARLMLAQLSASGCNCLLLDEPTNHLDISSRVQLEQALDAFKGAVLMVTHDRYFIDRFAEQVWEICAAQIRVRDGSTR